MHTYQHSGSLDEPTTLPPIASLTFDSVDDLVELASIDPAIGRVTWPEVWHLDDDGRFQCYLKGSTMESVRSWAEDPEGLRRSRQEGLATGGCGDRWLIVESRPTSFHPPPTVDESDAAAFLELRSQLDLIGVDLIDAVIFDDKQHWWSLRELTAGTTAWRAREPGYRSISITRVSRGEPR